MRLVDLYLLGYFTLIAGAIYTLYRSNVLQRLPPVWIAGFGVVAIAAGVLLRVVSVRPRVPDDPDR